MGSAKTAAAVLCLVALLYGVGGAAAQRVQLPCERITGITNCVECIANTKRCVWVADRYHPVWSAAGVLTSAKLATTGTTCTTSSGDPNCLRCDGVWCIQCKTGYQFNTAYKCVTGTVAHLSRNPKCAAINPDGTCTKCTGTLTSYLTRLYLVPLNAIYLNGPTPDSQCLTRTQLQAEALNLTGKPLSIHSGCIEVTPDFKCARCLDNYTLTPTNTCVSATATTANKCVSTLPYRQYCSKCTTTGTACTTCTWGRSLLSGRCSLNCKRMFGIGCVACNSSYCTKTDPIYANGR